MKEDIAYSFNENIQVVDAFRYHRRTYSGSLGYVERLRLAKMVDNGLEKYDQSLWNQIQKESEEIVEPLKFAESNKLINFYSTVFLSMLDF